MKLDEIVAFMTRICSEMGGNFISGDIAISPTVAGLRMYEAPIAGVARADDETFEMLRRPDVIGSHFLPPAEWLPGARSVLSFFFPFTEAVRSSNAATPRFPSEAWLHARIEGQAFIGSAMRCLREALKASGFATVVPVLEPRFFASEGLAGEGGARVFSSNWSERHVAYVCGLGTFGLSKGLITKRGVAGRCASLVTALELPATQREYDGPYDWCSMCGTCVRNCPAAAISLKEGKAHSPCSAFLDEMKIKYKPRYGCGKCQVGVPCESRALRNPKV